MTVSQSGSYNNKDAMAASTREQEAIFCACDLAVGASLAEVLLLMGVSSEGCSSTLLSATDWPNEPAFWN